MGCGREGRGTYCQTTLALILPIEVAPVINIQGTYIQFHIQLWFASGFGKFLAQMWGVEEKEGGLTLSGTLLVCQTTLALSIELHYISLLSGM